MSMPPGKARDFAIYRSMVRHGQAMFSGCGGWMCAHPRSQEEGDVDFALPVSEGTMGTAGARWRTKTRGDLWSERLLLLPAGRHPEEYPRPRATHTFRRAATVDFAEDALRLAFLRCEGKCQCIEEGHDHGHFTCKTKLEWSRRGKQREGGWKAKAIRPDELGGAGNPDNCLILCWECCQNRAAERGHRS